MRYKNITFDFDGTIADTYHIGLQVLKEMYTLGYAKKKVSKKDLNEFRKMTNKEILRYLDIPRWRVPWLVNTYQKRMNQKISNADFFPGMLELVTKLKDNFNLFILSSNSLENIVTFFEAKGLNTKDYFKNIYAGKSIFSKTRKINKLIEKEKLKKKETIYVGDEVKDIESSRKADIDIISVTWGLSHKDFLISFNPTYLINSIDELDKFFLTDSV